MSYSRAGLVEEAEWRAGRWVSEWLDQQANEVFEAIARDISFNLDDHGYYLEAVVEAIVGAYLRDAYAAAAQARNVDPRTAHVRVEDGIRLSGREIVDTGATLHYFNPDDSSSVAVPALVMRHAWPEHEGDWDWIELRAKQRSGLVEPERSTRFSALRKDFGKQTEVASEEGTA